MTQLSIRRLCLVGALWSATALLALSSPAAARKRHHRHAASPAPAAEPVAAPARAEAQSQPPLDDLYRRRGYGVGGAVFGGDTAMAGSCADLRFAQPASCGRGYGIYGNGLGTGFGF